jgi:hypothetical protein
MTPKLKHSKLFVLSLCKFSQTIQETEQKTEKDIDYGKDSIEGKIISEFFPYNDDYDPKIDMGEDIESEDSDTEVGFELLSDLEYLHELHYKINEISDIESKHTSSPLIENKLKKAKQDFIEKFDISKSEVLSAIIYKYSEWVQDHLPNSRGSHYISEASKYAEIFALGYFPLKRTNSLDIIEIVERTAAEILSDQIDPETVAMKLSKVPRYKPIGHLFYNPDYHLLKICRAILTFMEPDWYKAFPELCEMAISNSIKEINEKMFYDLETRFPRARKTIEIVQKALDMLKSCGDDVNKVMAAISYALNVQHNTGAMTEYLNIDKKELDNLTAQLKSLESIWSREIQELLQPQTYQEMLGRGGQQDPYDTNNGFSSYSSKNNIKVIMKF